MDYKVEYTHQGDKKYECIDLAALNERRSELLEKQNDIDEPIIFCQCDSDRDIPMILTKHSPTPHFQTKAKMDQSKHSRFCPHYIDPTDKQPYVPAITVDEEGHEVARVSFSRSDSELESDIPAEYRENNQFLFNSGSRVYRGKMSFDAFIKYKNMQFFKINQYSKMEYGIQKYTSQLWKFISSSTVNGKELSNLGHGSFFYYIVDKIEPNEYGNHYVLSNNFGDKVTIRNTVIDAAAEKFSNAYNGLSIETVLARSDCRLVFYGFKDKSRSKYFQFKHVSFLMTNKNGLFSESLNEVKMYNMICENILHKNSNWVFYKPTGPENDYAMNPNFVADGVIRRRGERAKIIVEVFGRNDPEYLERKRIKESTCKHDKLFWDVFDPVSFSECEKKVKLMK